MSWTTIESDAGVFTDLIENLGVKDVEVDELYSLDVDSLRQFPDIYGIIFLFKWNSKVDKPDGTMDYDSMDNIFFAKQVINNACATQALLSVLLNHSDEIDLGTTLSEFKDFSKTLPPELKGEALGNSEHIRCCHNSFARSDPFISEEVRAATDEDEVYHFIAYTNINNVFYELDGLQAAPINHGSCTKEEFAEKAVSVIQARIANYDPAEIRFNLMVICKDKKASLLTREDLTDEEKAASIAVEDEKRLRWKRENQLRRHNFVGLFVELSKLLVKDRIDKNTWNSTLETAKAKYASQKRP
ncbi:ubiquitin C-terminal hydrolase Uch2 [Schizosaccharomyces pombe]|uniref:Ubiquitin carboxyl-terminal hydrolase 2 n=1 Tax=Schizosaccharomyces pombe (strain 972 / ATCC 24843) TaxID=284812 RepID=UBLH2_SCHPO|nr:ubiquitin hydrolase Uch2 [Schizosaccharomyces pombe]Q9UUB6.1 RecName: Full=Ubiquitin carboxyl-terminal hydrolase 2 [Schizosaccharomyces pombe 972h-]CAB52608.1 ubiquitin C-terminal hydrolase Uch2 [Schizosaccharomyces pombe]|eukprot:NP_595456.1 ubiquitin hydrolase Uch2 [Schizosaccharomyces pombe]